MIGSFNHYVAPIENIEADTYVMMKLYYEESTLMARCVLYWSWDGQSEQVVPDSAFFHGENLMGSSGYFDQEVLPTTVPSKSSYSSPSTATAGIPFTVQIESLNNREENHAVPNAYYANAYLIDTYRVVIEDSDPAGSKGYTAFDSTATRTATPWLYELNIDPAPTIMGDYTLSITLGNTYTSAYPDVDDKVKDTPMTITVFPG